MGQLPSKNMYLLVNLLVFSSLETSELWIYLMYSSNIVKCSLNFYNQLQLDFRRFLKLRFTTNIISSLDFIAIYNNVPNNDLYFFCIY